MTGRAGETGDTDATSATGATGATGGAVVASGRRRRVLTAVAVVIGLGCAALAWGACVRLLGFRPPGRNAFEHRAHVLAGVSCSECHRGVADSRRADPLHLPTPATCMRCHAEPHDSRPCMQCHGMPYTAWDVQQVRDHLRFDHARHREASTGQCVRCHSAVAHGDGGLRPTMAICLSCHQHADQFRTRDCDGCHVNLRGEGTRPESHLVHDGAFLQEHGARAASAGDLCASCHRETFCAGCHGATVPALPSRMGFDRAVGTGLHRAGFRARHADEAHAQPGLCASCHSPASCDGCHTAEGVSANDPRKGSPHPPGWVGVTRNDHGPAARRDPVACASCHSGAGEQLCVGCHRVGGIGGDPHPPGWTSPRQTSELPCRLCHLGASGSALSRPGWSR